MSHSLQKFNIRFIVIGLVYSGVALAAIIQVIFNKASLFLVTLFLSGIAQGFLIPSATTSKTTDITPICAIQGSGFQSSYQGKTVRTRGVVHADLDDSARKGFFIQMENCDWNPATSDGIFVYLNERIDIVSAGDFVEVYGQIQEYFGLTELVADSSEVILVSTGHPLPAPVELDPPFDNGESNAYFERLEAMRVSLGQAAVVGPTGFDDRTWVVRSDLGMTRVFHNDTRGTGEIICIDDGGLFEINPEVKVPDTVANLLGVMDYKGGDFCMQLFSMPVVYFETFTNNSQDTDQEYYSSPILKEAALTPDLRLATFNLANLFDTTDDPLVDDTVISASEYQRRLGKRALAINELLNEPAIIALQEAENDDVLQALINRPEIVSDYEFIWQNGPDVRSMDLAFIFRPDIVEMIEFEARQECTSLVDGLGPDGNRDVYNPVNESTCDTDNNGTLDGNRLFSRPPLLAHFYAELGNSEGANSFEPVDIWVINNHLKSKLQDSEMTQYTLPRRIQQAEFVNSLVEEIISSHPESIVVILGDLNDHIDSEPLEILSANLYNQFASQPREERYTYIYHGLSQVLDHILLRTHLPVAPVEFEPIHVNADFPSIFETVDNSFYRCSDHDLLILKFIDLHQHTFLPFIQR